MDELHERRRRGRFWGPEQGPTRDVDGDSEVFEPLTAEDDIIGANIQDDKRKVVLSSAVDQQVQFQV